MERQRALPGEVECTSCIGRKRKADKSCLDCLSSYCEAHFNRHQELHSAKRHKVVEAVDQLEDRVCSKHNKPLEVWCHTDQVCVCLLCIIDDHKGHDIIMADAAKTEKQVGDRHMSDLDCRSPPVRAQINQGPGVTRANWS